MGNGPNITDWITAVAALIGAFGTVAAVWFAVTQSRRATQTDLRVTTWLTWADDNAAIVLTVTNRGLRTAVIEEPLFMGVTNAGQQIAGGGNAIEGFAPESSRRIEEGESTSFTYDAAVLEPKSFKDGKMLYAAIADQFEHWVYAPMPGVQAHHGWLRRVLGREPRFEHKAAGLTATAYMNQTTR